MKRYFEMYLFLLIAGIGLIISDPFYLIGKAFNKADTIDEKAPAWDSYNFNELISKEEIQKIDAAIPAKASVKPQKQRKLLVVTLNVRDGKVNKGHSSITYGSYAIKTMGEKTGAYETFFCNDTLIFKPENLKQFDAICFNNTTGVLFNDPALRKSLLDYIAGGKGFVGIHAAAATFVQSPVYDQFPPFGEMVGGTENWGHPWKANETITLKVEEPDHPINAAFHGQGFQVSDEVFQFQKPYTRDKLRILLTIDPSKTDMNPKRHILPERLKDMDFAISWIRDYSKGRVFYSSLGHNPHIFWDQKILQHFLDGIQFAMGDLQASATPSNQVKRK